VSQGGVPGLPYDPGVSSAAGGSLIDAVGEGWPDALAPVAGVLSELGDFLRGERAAGRGFLPSGGRILRAFTTPLDAVRVLIVGQDPYPTPGHPVGLSFSVDPGVRPLPPSLANIFREYQSDLGLPPPGNGDLSAWAERGVMLLNRVLTVRPGAPGSHRGRGWEAVTDQAIRALAARDRPLVAILWGRDARALRPLLGDQPAIESAHPSPLSASSGFFGSRPFSRANALLAEAGREAVDWRLP
jgi:uracil-DNA glycosylase